MHERVDIHISNGIFDIRKLKEDNPGLCSQLRQYTYDIIGACQEVHRELGAFLNEYVYQDALELELNHRGLTGNDCIREHYFTMEYKGVRLKHTHKMDFLINRNVIIECKAIASLAPEQRQQLWNYMRLTHIPLGILYNFAPMKDQCERYYFDEEAKIMYAF